MWSMHEILPEPSKITGKNMATINTDATSVKGLIIFPDVYTAGTPAGVTWGTINASSSGTTVIVTKVAVSVWYL